MSDDRGNRLPESVLRLIAGRYISEYCGAMNPMPHSEPHAQRAEMFHSSVCQARYLGSGHSVECLAASPPECVHAAHFGGRFLCRHPRGEWLVIEAKFHRRVARAMPGVA